MNHHHGSAAFHGGVSRPPPMVLPPSMAAFLRITQKDLHVRTTIIMVPFHRLPIDAPPWQAALPSGFIRMYSRFWGNLLHCGRDGKTGLRKIIIMLHGASSGATGQAEEEHCKDDKRHSDIHPVSLNREGNYGKENPHDRGCNQHKQAKLNHSPA